MDGKCPCVGGRGDGLGANGGGQGADGDGLGADGGGLGGRRAVRDQESPPEGTRPRA